MEMMEEGVDLAMIWGTAVYGEVEDDGVLLLDIFSQLGDASDHKDDDSMAMLSSRGI